MHKYLFPKIALADLLPMFGVGLVGAVIAGSYGIVHDQVTFSISAEYFTKLKFDQFHYADAGLGDRVFVGTIGFLATWWVGFIVGWFLARRLLPEQPRRRAYRQIATGFGIVITCCAVFGLAGFAYGQWRGPNADDSAWRWVIEQLEVSDTWSFVRVAYIHNAGYLGGVIGLVIALMKIRPETS